MEKLLYEERNISSGRKIMMGVCGAIFLFIGILVFAANSQIPDFSFYSSAKTGLTILGIICMLEVLYSVAAIIAMNKSEIKIYDKHIEGWQYNVIFAKNYYLKYTDITGIQSNNSAVIIYAQGKQIGHKSKNQQKIYTLLMEQWEKNK